MFPETYQTEEVKVDNGDDSYSTFIKSCQNCYHYYTNKFPTNVPCAGCVRLALWTETQVCSEVENTTVNCFLCGAYDGRDDSCSADKTCVEARISDATPNSLPEFVPLTVPEVTDDDPDEVNTELKFKPSFTLSNVTAEDNGIDHPSHYTDKGMECWDWYGYAMTKEEYVGALKGNVFKYMYRAGQKDDVVKDLKKAQAYLNKLILTMEESDNETCNCSHDDDCCRPEDSDGQEGC